MIASKNVSKLLFLCITLLSLDVLLFVDDTKGEDLTEVISLYDENDDVLELHDDSIENIVESGKIWIVEFYAHWCGHCQRFAPKWKQVATKFKVWNEWVNIAAINCAQEDCRDFSIVGTPTVRLFGPHYPGQNENETQNVGRDIPARHELEYWYETILSEIETVQTEEEQFKDESDSYNALIDQGLKKLTPYNASDTVFDMFSYKTSSPASQNEFCNHVNEYLVAVFESPKYHAIGRPSEEAKISHRAILEQYQNFPHLKVNRILPNDTADFLDALSLFESDEGISRDTNVDLPDYTLQSPGLLIYTFSSDESKAKCVPTYNYHPFMIHNITIPDNVTYEIIYKLLNEYQMDIVNNMTLWIKEDAQITSSDLQTERPETTTKGEALIVDYPTNDNVSSDDIERAIRKSLVDEVARHSTLPKEHTKTLYHWISALMKYLPLRKPVYTFLTELRQQLNQKMRADNFTEMTGDEYVELLDELLDKHQPFNDTSPLWVGCLGSDPKFRGYPCSLWQTFHSITVGALLADGLEMNEMVSTTIVDYVQHFFTCRHCAEHFIKEVRKTNDSLPMWPSDTVFWMWRLHNMANLRLKGDLTEDPEHPKTFWPSDKKCPKCYSWKGERALDVDNNLAVLVSGKLSNGTVVRRMVNKMEVVNYLTNVYGFDNDGEASNPIHVGEKASNIIDLVEELLEMEDTSNKTLPEGNNITDVIRTNVEKELDDYCEDISVKENHAYQYNLF